jgi:hypothetical protein
MKKNKKTSISNLTILLIVALIGFSILLPMQKLQENEKESISPVDNLCELYAESDVINIRYQNNFKEILIKNEWYKQDEVINSCRSE